MKWKNKNVAAVLALVVLSAGAARAQSPSSGWLGGGVILGDPIGPTGKYWLSARKALDIGFGFEDDPVVYGDVLWQGWNAGRKPQGGNFGGYLGLGPRYQAMSHDDDKWGLRTVAGVNWFFDGAPIEIFGEVAPVFQIAPKLDTDVDAGIGVRVYFVP